MAQVDPFPRPPVWLPSGALAPFVVPSGQIFYASTPSSAALPWRWAGVSAFPLAHLFEVGGGALVDPILDYFRPLGYNLLRVWDYWDHPEGWADSPALDTWLQFVEYLRVRGWQVEVTLLTDDRPERLPHARDLARALSPTTNVLLEIGNEPLTHKSIDVEAMRSACDDSGLFYSNGVYEDEFRWFGHYVTPHTDRDHEWPRRAHDLLEWWNGDGPHQPHPPVKAPAVADEPIRPDQAGYVTADFYAYAATCSLLGAGATFHYEGGKHGRVPDAQEAACAEAMARGLTVFPADAPLGPYRRIDEHGDSLRTYVVGPYMVRVRPTTPVCPEPNWVPLDTLGICFKR